jgi:para-nitrobenzyl esterase
MHRSQQHESSMSAFVPMTKPFFLLLGFLLIFKLCGRVTASDPDLLKHVSGGLVQGVWEDVKQQSSDTLHADSKVAIWKSIPYGQAPVGPLRWRAPLPAPRWSGTLDGSVYRPPCIQPDGSGSEDCLHVHVTTPPGALNDTFGLLPVLVYIHGGGLMDGSGIYEYMSAFALHANVVVVAINYRLNVFGWLALDSLRDPDGSVGNYGMRDQQLALSWVRSNVGVFGGDPGRLTVAGQSSGGTSIFALYCSPFSVGLFDAAISMSGSINISMGTAQAFSQNEVIADLLQCTGVSTSECLRNTSVQQLVRAQQNSSWGRTPGIFGLDKTSPSGLSPSKDWFGTSLNTPTAHLLGLRVMRLHRYPGCRRGEHRAKLF